MYAVGHLALGFLTGRTFSKILKVDTSIPLLFVVAVLPDVDLLIPGLRHRGPTHSIIIWSLLFIPFFLFYPRMVIPYFIALVQHTLLGDFITEATQLLWPLTSDCYGMGIKIRSLTDIGIEWVSFLLLPAVMLQTGEIREFLRPHSSNLLLWIPVSTAILPAFLNFPLYVPLELVPPHLFFAVLFIIAILVDLRHQSARYASFRRKNLDATSI